MSNSIKNIIKGCLKKDRVSQNELYKMYYSLGMSICIRYVKNEQEAIEVLNTGFFKVFKNIKDYDINRPIKPWISKILVNTALTFLKQKKVHFHNSIDALSIEPNYSMNIDSDIDYEEMIKMIQTLSVGYRTVFNLYVIDGYKHDEIAKKLNISVGASKSNLSRAKKKLQQVFAQIKNTHYA